MSHMPMDAPQPHHALPAKDMPTMRQPSEVEEQRWKVEKTSAITLIRERKKKTQKETRGKARDIQGGRKARSLSRRPIHHTSPSRKTTGRKKNRLSRPLPERGRGSKKKKKRGHDDAPSPSRSSRANVRARDDRGESEAASVVCRRARQETVIVSRSTIHRSVVVSVCPLGVYPPVKARQILQAKY